MPQSRLSLHGRVLRVNRAMATLLDEPVEALLGRDALAMYVDEDREGLQQALGRMASGQDHVVRQDRALRLHDGRRVEVVRTTTLARDEHGSSVIACSLEDVTALRRAEREARLQAERFSSLLDTMPVAVFTFDPTGVCTSSRGSALARLGLSDGEMVGARLFETYAHVPEAVSAMRAALSGDEVPVHADADGRSWETRYRPLRDVDGRVVGGLGIALDVTERATAEREVRANEARMRALLRHSSDVVLVVDRDARVLFVSPSVTTHFGYDDRSLVWQDTSAYEHPDDRPRLEAAWRRVLRQPGSVERFETRVRHADGSWRWTAHVVTNLLDDPDVAGVVLHLHDLSEQRRTELELERRSLHDGLTGLPVRALLLDRVDQVLARRLSDGVGLVVLDVRGLAAVNARLGQSGGDEVLRVVADRLLEASRAGDSVARLGGGTFAVLVQELASAEDLRARASTLADVAGGTVAVDDGTVEVGLRLGTAATPAADAGALLAAAEESLREAGDGVGATLVSRAAACPEVKALARAVAEGELRLHLQPVQRLDGTVTGVEALVRWQHPRRGLLLPAEFVPLAESSGLVVGLGDHVLREACRQLADWDRLGLRLDLAVNLSPLQLVGDGFVDRVAELLAESGAPPERLVLEVTESAFMDDPGAPDVLRAVSALGVRLALDDFGTGYSSLTYLKRFPVDAIKVDRSFVAGLGRDADDEAIVASVVSLARAIGKTVVAEGVETPIQLEVLRELGVDLAQGFLWSPALPIDELETWLGARPDPGQRPPAHRGGSRRVQPDDGDVRRLMQLHGEGASLHTIAAALNVEQRRTPGGQRWTTTTVARTIASRVRPG